MACWMRFATRITAKFSPKVKLLIIRLTDKLILLIRELGPSCRATHHNPEQCRGSKPLCDRSSSCYSVFDFAESAFLLLENKAVSICH
jgi:hypothetical protein